MHRAGYSSNGGRVAPSSRNRRRSRASRSSMTWGARFKPGYPVKCPTAHTTTRSVKQVFAQWQRLTDHIFQTVHSMCANTHIYIYIYTHTPVNMRSPAHAHNSWFPYAPGLQHDHAPLMVGTIIMGPATLNVLGHCDGLCSTNARVGEGVSATCQLQCCLACRILGFARRAGELKT
jgi:hypothetical protein